MTMRSASKVVIRRRKEPLYFSHGVWVAENSAAEDFSTAERALTTCAGLGLEDVEVVLQFGTEPDSEHDLSVPFQPAYAKHRSKA
jgi:hypothetical protein